MFTILLLLVEIGTILYKASKLFTKKKKKKKKDGRHRILNNRVYTLVIRKMSILREI